MPYGGASGGAGGPHASSHLAGGSDAIDWAGSVHQRGTTVGLPGASSSNVGYLYADTDLNLVYRSNGSTWDTIADIGGGGGHTIKDAGSAMTARANLDFQDGFALTDNAGANATEVDLDYGTATTLNTDGSAANGSGSPVARADHKHAIPSTLDTNARVAVRKNSTGSVFTRRRLNLIEGTNVTLTVADDSGDEEVDVTINASGGSSTIDYVTPLLTMGA